MLIIGCDFHTRFQKIAMMDTTTGELVKQNHGDREQRQDPQRMIGRFPEHVDASERMEVSVTRKGAHRSVDRSQSNEPWQ